MGMTLELLGAKVGDQITLTTVGGQVVAGHVVEIDVDEDDGVRKLAVEDDPSRDDPVWVRGDSIELWRFGRPVQVPMVGQNGLQQVPLTPEMLRQLKGR